MTRPELIDLVVFLIVAAAIVFRLTRPMRSTASRLSLIPFLIRLSALGLRFGLRVFLPQAGLAAMAASDGFLAFAVTSVIASRDVISEGCTVLHAV